MEKLFFRLNLCYTIQIIDTFRAGFFFPPEGGTDDGTDEAAHAW